MRIRAKGKAPYGKITVLGLGSRGTALAHSLCAKGHEVYLWSRKEETARALTAKNENERYLPGVSLAGIHFTSDIAAVREAEACILAVPSHAIRETAVRIAPHVFCGQAVISAAKGFDPESGNDRHYGLALLGSYGHELLQGYGAEGPQDLAL